MMMTKTMMIKMMTIKMMLEQTTMMTIKMMLEQTTMMTIKMMLAIVMTAAATVIQVTQAVTLLPVAAILMLKYVKNIIVDIEYPII
jgi:hypothetical protein